MKIFRGMHIDANVLGMPISMEIFPNKEFPIPEDVSFSVMFIDKQNRTTFSRMEFTDEGMKILRYVILSDKMSVSVHTSKDGKIVYTAPIVKRFVGQHLNDLLKWLNSIRANPTLHYLGQ